MKKILNDGARFSRGTRWRVTEAGVVLSGLKRLTGTTVSGGWISAQRELTVGTVIESRGIENDWGSDPWFSLKWRDPTGEISYATIRVDDADNPALIEEKT